MNGTEPQTRQCSWHEANVPDTRCTEPARYVVTYFSNDSRFRKDRLCGKHLGRTVSYVAKTRDPDSINIRRMADQTQSSHAHTVYKEHTPT